MAASGRKLAQSILGLAARQAGEGLGWTPASTAALLPGAHIRHFSLSPALQAAATSPLKYHQFSAELKGLSWQDLQPDRQKEFPDAAPVTDKECQCLLQVPAHMHLQQEESSDNTPLVLVFGWAGSTHKHVAKYSDIWREAGCTTLQYILPSRHIFRDTPQVPVIMDRLVTSLEDLNLINKPVFIHCLSDTGVICYQGLDLVLKARRQELDVRGVVWDSCPGPRPVMTAPRALAIMYINYLCCLRNGLGRAEAAHNSYRLLVDRGWPNYLRKLKGLEVSMNLMQGVWCGHFGRDHNPDIPELFLYSKRDFYIPWRYLEDEVLSIRQSQPDRDFRCVRWDDSAHVGHLRRHGEEYRKLVTQFMADHWEADEVEQPEKREQEAAN